MKKPIITGMFEKVLQAGLLHSERWTCRAENRSLERTDVLWAYTLCKFCSDVISSAGVVSGEQ